MIAADTSSLVAYLAGERGADTKHIDDALAAYALVLPPVVLTEILSDPANAESIRPHLNEVPLLDPTTGYWERAGSSRSSLRRLGLKAKLGDALIAQCCIDNDVALITRDGDFRHFEKHCGLKLA